MARGRKSAPAEVKAAKGNPGKRENRVVPTEELPALTSAAPDTLTARGKAIWADISKRLEHIKLLRETDSNALARYCDMLAEYWEITDAMREQGRTYEAPMTNGGTMMRINPLFMMRDRLGRQLNVMEERFGLTPRSRQEIMYRMAQQVPTAPKLPLEGDVKGGEDASPPVSPVGFLGGGNGAKVH